MRSIQECQTFHFDAEGTLWCWNIVVLDEKSPHMRNTRDGTVIMLDVNSGVYNGHVDLSR